MTTLQDVLDKTNELYPWEKVETRNVRDKILRELFHINQEQKNWNRILIKNQSQDLDDVLRKHFPKSE